MLNSDQNSADQKQLDNAYDWLRDHGQIDYKYLKKLAQAGTSESVERLHELADDNNITYDDTTDMMQLADEINRAMETNSNIGVE
ncbi:hypothetical protein [Pedobacter sp.]|jgi:hypothetical protein|uniref:hypothetical protein n=1 Tax=Pedobacter sp. TaxID=1411316 RepID=UPI002BC4C6FB|nr:hypothetical protein [Pedobacter sp.]HWW41998.1 hypothetical protein [Pedobacter sp.]